MYLFIIFSLKYLQNCTQNGTHLEINLNLTNLKL